MYDSLLLVFEPIFIGSIGAFIVLVPFIMGQIHKWKDTYFIYDFMNFLGSLMLMIYAMLGASWPFVILNGIWSLVSLKDCISGLSRNFKKQEKLSFWEKWMK